VIILQRNLIDYAAKMNLLAYSSSDFEDHIGLLVGTTRLPADRARTTIKFTLSTALPNATEIPVGIRVTPGDGNIYFATAETLTIPAGETEGEVLALCLVTGTAGNGFLPGQINRPVDPLPYVQSVANTTTSEGGADIEDDESFRDRIHLAPEHFSVAGPKGAYEFWAKTANAGIVDVQVLGPEDGTDPGEVKIYPLMQGGIIPGEEILDLVYDTVSAGDIRPDTDHVFVLPPEVVTYDADVTYWIDRTNATRATAIQTAVNMAFADWIVWQASKLGRDINPSELNHRLVAAGAKRTEIRTPEFAELLKYQVGKIGTQNLVYGGLEDG